MADATGTSVNPAENGFLGTTVAVTGTLIKTNGTVLSGAIVRASAVDIPQQVTQGSDKYTLGKDAVETITEASGSFSFYVIAGSRIRLTIPAVGFDQVVDIPDDGTTTIDFLGLTAV